MTQSTELLPIVQADREFAAKHTMRGHGKIGGYTFSAEYMILNGRWDDDPLVQDAARHRIEHNTPDRNAVLRVAAGNMADVVERLTDAIERQERDIGGESVKAVLPDLGPAYDALRAALTTTPEPTDPAGVPGVAEELAEWIYKARAEVATFERSSRATTAQLIAVADRALAALRPSPVLEVEEKAIDGLIDDETTSRRILELAFADAGLKLPFFGEAYEPGVVIRSIVLQAAALQAIKEGEAR